MAYDLFRLVGYESPVFFAGDADPSLWCAYCGTARSEGERGCKGCGAETWTLTQPGNGGIVDSSCPSEAFTRAALSSAAEEGRDAC